MIHEVHGKRERGERETEKETASKGRTVDFSARPSRDLGGRVEGEARGESFLCSLLYFCTPPNTLLSPQRPQNPSRGQPPAPSNEDPGPLATGGFLWHHMFTLASPIHHSFMACATHTSLSQPKPLIVALPNIRLKIFVLITTRQFDQL